MSTVRLAENNSIEIPAEIIQKLGLVPGVSFSLVETDGELVLRTIATAAESLSTPVGTGGKSLNDAIARKNLAVGMQFIKGIGPKLAKDILSNGQVAELAAAIS